MRTNFDKNNARLHFQRADMVKAHSDQLKLEEENKIQSDHNAINEAAYLSIGSDIHTKRMRQQNAARSMQYKEHFATVALTEALSDCVKNALLLNTDEYAKLNENYEAEISETVKGFLENAEINENIDNPIILSLYEEIMKEVPPADLYLSEEDERMIVRTNILSKDAIKNGLESLCRDVRARAANIVSKDQESMVKQDDEINSIADKELESAPLVAPTQEPMATAEVPLADPDAEQDAIDPVAAPEVINSDGTEIEPVQEAYAPRIVKEQKKQGIVETLAMNEATKMLSEGKEYNSTLALANALKYITILETLDASGLVKIGTEGYNRILSASGVDMTPVRASDIPGSAIEGKPMITVKKTETITELPKVELPETKKESDLRNKISEIVKSSMPKDLTLGRELTSDVFKPYDEWKKEHKTASIQVFDTPDHSINEEVDLTGKYTNMKGEVFTEAALRDFFENQGFNLDLTDFESLWHSWNFKKH